MGSVICGWHTYRENIHHTSCMCSVYISVYWRILTYKYFCIIVRYTIERFLRHNSHAYAVCSTYNDEYITYTIYIFASCCFYLSGSKLFYTYGEEQYIMVLLGAARQILRSLCILHMHACMHVAAAGLLMFFQSRFQRAA